MLVLVCLCVPPGSIYTADGSWTACDFADTLHISAEIDMGTPAFVPLGERNRELRGGLRNFSKGGCAGPQD